jgi:hypothetical protein
MTATKMGRPVKAPEERLQAYGLHISQLARTRLNEIKSHLGISVRDWVEQQIAYSYDEIFNDRASRSELRRTLRETQRKLAEAEAQVAELKRAAT